MTTYYIVQLAHETWLGPEWTNGPEPGETGCLKHARRFTTRETAENALAEAREYRPFRDAFVDRLKATVI
jgi:hypothetical protein